MKDQSLKSRLAHCMGWLIAATIAFLPACASQRHVAQNSSGAAPSAATPYAGFALGQDAEGGAVVLDVIAGPAALAGLEPGDKILTAAGERATAQRLLEMIRSATPGTRLPLRVLRNGRAIDAQLIVADRAQWAAPAEYPARVAFTEPSRDRDPVWLDAVERKVAAAAPQLGPARERLDKMFAALARQNDGFNNLLLNRQALAEPGTLIDRERRLVKEMQSPAQARNQIVPLLCEMLVLECGGIKTVPPDAATVPQSLARFAQSVSSANQKVRQALANAPPRAQLFADLRYLLEETAVRRTLIEQPDALKGIRAMQASMRVDFGALVEAFNELIVAAAQAPTAMTGAKKKIPAALAAMVEGEILDYAQVDGGYIVIGGPGANRYRMDRLYAVIDVGGDDQYVWNESVPLETQIVIDVAGNDRYEAIVGGPGAGWLGAAVLIDMAGDDSYISKTGGCGAGAFGIGLLFDAAGADTYRCDFWSSGTGIYGAGVLLDAGDGWDTYISQSLSQGVGGPGGIGLLIDYAGDDLYRANGAVPSSYGTPTTFMSFSQGVGFGIRPYDHGGFGALIDYGGNDRYEGGEFSQGGGYYWGVGLLHDAAGNDFYYGGRYTQGFAAHQAVGLFSDMAGDDVYWAMRAAAQGAAWDESVAMMFEGGGNDSYRAESLAQGAAAQQSRAWLFDAGGNDVYWSSGDAQGVAGDNSYHYVAEDPIESLGVLIDGGGTDRYSTGLENGQVRIRRAQGNPPGGRENSGLAIDEGP